MSFSPFDRNPSGIVFFGTSATDKLYESASTFTYDAVNGAIRIPNGGYIGTQGDFDSIQIASNGNVSLTQSLSIAGDLTVNGTTTTVNSTTVTIQDPVIVLGSGSPTADDNFDRGIAFNWHTGSAARSGFFGWDDSAQGFALYATGNMTNNTFSSDTGGLAWLTVHAVSGNLVGNATTATTLQNTRTFSVSGQTLATAQNFNGGANVTLTTALDKTAITAQPTLVGSVDGANDFILLYDASLDGLTKVTRSNFVSGLGSMSNFIISDGTTTQTVQDADTLFFRSGPAISFTVSATDQVSGTLNAGVAGNGLTMASQVLSVGAGNGITVAADSVSVTAGSGISVDANGVHVIAGTGLVNTAAGLQLDFNEFSAVAVASGDSFATLDSDLATEQRTTVSDLGSYFAGQANAGIGVVGDGRLTIDLSEYVTPVAFASGDSFLVLDSDGSTEQRGTVSQLGAYLAGTNVTAAGDGKLSVTDASIEAAVFTAVNFVDSSRIDFTVTAGQSVTADVIDASITNAKLRNSAAMSVIGRSANSAGVPADIETTQDNQVLRRSGTSIGFGAINLASSDAVTGDLPFSNLAQGSALSVLGVTGNATADVASIAAGTDGHVLRRSGTSLSFGTIATAGLADGAVTEVKRSRTVANVSSTSSITNDINLVTAATNITLTLPTAAGSTGRMVSIKKIDTGAGTVTIQGTSGQTIDDAASFILYHQYECITVVSDGAEWFVI